MTKLDVLDGMEAVKICVGYRETASRRTGPGGSARPALVSDEFPADLDWLSRCEPVYESLPGWRDETGEVGRFEELPLEAQRYLRRLEALLGVSIGLISTGSKREQIFRVSP